MQIYQCSLKCLYCVGSFSTSTIFSTFLWARINEIKFTLTEWTPARVSKCSHPKWPTMNFIALNRCFGLWEWLIKIFPNFSHGKGEIFALKVWFFWKKWIKSCTSLESWGIEPRSPGWKSGILSTILWKVVMKSGVKLGFSFNASDILVIKKSFL